jgi:hypothetical protein
MTGPLALVVQLSDRRATGLIPTRGPVVGFFAIAPCLGLKHVYSFRSKSPSTKTKDEKNIFEIIYALLLQFFSR